MRRDLASTLGMKKIYDFVVIGGGSAGYNAAATAARLGLSALVIEGGAEVGGLCILRGCMPSKTLIESANRFRSMRRAAEFGLHAENLSVAPEEIIARKEKLIGEFADYRREQLESGKFDFVRGWATFRDAQTLVVSDANGGESAVSGKTFLIATGSTTKLIEIPGLRDVGFLDSDAVLDSKRLPRSIIVLGGGATAVEFTHYYEGLGSAVTTIQRSAQLLQEADEDVASSLAEAFRKRGIALHLNTKIVRVEKAGAMKRVVFEQDGEERFAEAEEIIYALGRKPQFEKLGLERAGVAVENDALAVSETQQTNVPHIFAAGDVAGPYEIVHIAIQQGEVAARNAARLLAEEDEPLEKSDYRLKLFITFSDPEVAVVGATEKELRAADVEFRAASYPFNDHGKSLVIGEPEGFVKLAVSEETGEILGAAAVGPHAGDLIHEIVVAMAFYATASELAVIPHYHPTLSEIWTYPAEELAVSGKLSRDGD